MKHTKGQWEVSKTGASVSIKSGDVWIAGIHNQDTMIEGKSIVDKDCYDTSETEANANLIASAPEMIEMLKVCVLQLPDETAEEVSNLIAKAEGKGKNKMSEIKQVSYVFSEECVECGALLSKIQDNMDERICMTCVLKKESPDVIRPSILTEERKVK